MRLGASRFAAVVLAAAAVASVPGSARAGDELDVPHTTKVLKNGLTLVVHEDHKAPIVAVNVWYHVGSKNEKPGRTGFAHLFEHLMFNGSEHHDDDWFAALVKLGATGSNGTTNEDRTNYFENVPTGALDTVLWLESDRMGHLLGAIDQAKLDEQRGVVQNEKRQNENAPYGRVWHMLPALTWPAGHPYSWSVIGSMEDLNAASLEDVKEWFRAYYGAANATLVVAGDVKTDEVVAKVEKYFGDIPPGPPVSRPEAHVVRRKGTVRWSTQERAPQPKLLKVWNTPGWGSPDSHRLELAAAVLARKEGSRLYQRLVWKERLATEVEAEQAVGEIASQFYVDVTVNAGADLARVEAILDEEMARLLNEGPTEEELATEKTQARAKLLLQMERVGGFGGKSDLLAESIVYGGSADAWKRRMAAIAAATPSSVRDTAKEWLGDGAFVMVIEPVPPLAAAKEGADRSKMPAPETPAEARFPRLQRAKLPNGLEVVLAERTGAETVRADLVVGAGYADDPAPLPGTARLTGALLSGGTKSRSSLELRRWGDRLGAEVVVETALDTSRVILSTLRESIDPSLEFLAEVSLRPAFPAAELEIHREGQLAEIAQERMGARGMVQRLLPRLLYGDGHPCAVPSSGSGTEAAVAKLSREDLAAFHGKWYRPGNATLVVTGNVSMASLLPAVQKHFGAWEAAEAPARTRPPAPGAGKSRIYLLDRPGAPQSSITASQLVPARGGPEELPLDIVNAVFGGMFSSRLNMNLREDKHWSYGARSVMQPVRGPRPFLAQASVQTDKTAESLAEMLKEIRGVAGERPITPAEMAAAADNMTLTLPGRWESSRAVAETIEDIVLFGLPDTYFDGYAGRIRAVKGEDVAAAGKILKPDSLVWIVCGDRKKVEEGLRKLGVADVVVVDADGKPVE
jgi:zinc protease